MYDTEKIEEDLQILAKNRKLALSYGEAVTRRRKRKEKSTIILVAIVMVFILCHMYRLFVEVYRLIYPSNILKENFYICNAKGKLTMPVLLYIFHNLHFLFLTINSSVNFIIKFLVVFPLFMMQIVRRLRFLCHNRKECNHINNGCTKL